MGFTLTVRFEKLPASLKEDWVAEFAKHGFDVEIWPDFDPTDGQAGFLPFRVRQAPEELIGFELPGDALSGFEVIFTECEAQFDSGMGRSTTEFAMQCIGAATLAMLTGGWYEDSQNDIEVSGTDALEAAKREIGSFLEFTGERGRVHDEFPGWEALT